MNPTPAASVAPPPIAGVPLPLDPPSIGPRRPTSALTVWALSLGVGAVAAVGALILTEWASTRADLAGAPIQFALLAPPLLGLAAFIVGIVATVRASRRGERVWMAVTGLVLGPVVLVVWLFAFAFIVAWAVSSGLVG